MPVDRTRWLCEFSPDIGRGKWIVSGGEDGQVVLWEAASGKVQQTWKVKAGIRWPVLLGQHLQRDCAADLCLGARCDVGHTARDAWGDRALPHIHHQPGDLGTGVGVEQEQLHGQAAVRLCLDVARTSSRAVPVRRTCAPSRRPAASLWRASSAARISACSWTELLQRRSAPSAR